MWTSIEKHSDCRPLTLSVPRRASCPVVHLRDKAHAFSMTPLTNAERMDSLTRIAGMLDRQKEEALRAGLDVLANLIGRALEEATRQLGGAEKTVP